MFPYLLGGQVHPALAAYLYLILYINFFALQWGLHQEFPNLMTTT